MNASKKLCIKNHGKNCKCDCMFCSNEHSDDFKAKQMIGKRNE